LYGGTFEFVNDPSFIIAGGSISHAQHSTTLFGFESLTHL
jgi:hypothetical protein